MQSDSTQLLFSFINLNYPKLKNNQVMRKNLNNDVMKVNWDMYLIYVRTHVLTSDLMAFPGEGDFCHF